MVGRTGWELAVDAGSFVLDITVAFNLARPERLGMEGAAIAQALTLTTSAIVRVFLVRRFGGSGRSTGSSCGCWDRPWPGRGHARLPH